MTSERTGGEDANRRHLDEVIATEFAHMTDEALIRRMERAPDFGYDDECWELNRRLGAVGLTWMWEGNKVKVYKPEERR